MIAPNLYWLIIHYLSSLHGLSLVRYVKYVIAVADYTSDGKLIGDSVHDSTKSILANHPLPVLTTWAFLSQVCLFCE